MILDIIFLLFVCAILVIKLIKSFNGHVLYQKTHNHRNHSTKSVKKIDDIIVEDVIIEDEELKQIDQEILLHKCKNLITNVWNAFSSGNLNSIRTSVSESIYINMESKIKIYSHRPELLKISVFKIKKLHKNHNKFFASIYLISELKEITRTYQNIEEWSLECNKDSNEWIIEYTSAF